MFFIDAGQTLVLRRAHKTEASVSVIGWIQELASIAKSSATWITLSLILTLSVCVGAVVHSSHLTRQLYAELAELNEKRDFYQSEWSQLLLEESALSAHGRIEKIAKDDMGMTMPDSKAVVIVR